jgi:hypothetical protein
MAITIIGIQESRTSVLSAGKSDSLAMGGNLLVVGGELLVDGWRIELSDF